MVQLVTFLHVYSTTHEVFYPAGFQKLHLCSEKFRVKILFELDRLAMRLFPRPLTLILINGDLENTSKSTLLPKPEY